MSKPKDKKSCNASTDSSESTVSDMWHIFKCSGKVVEVMLGFIFLLSDPLVYIKHTGFGFGHRQ